MIIFSTVLFVFSSAAYCADSYVKGEVAVVFKQDVKEEEASGFLKKFNLEIIRKGGFGPPVFHINVEDNADGFIKEIQKEPIVSSAAKGEKLEMDGKTGTVVRVNFKEGAARDEIEKLSVKYRSKKGVIAWRYYNNNPPFMIIKTPSGKEQYWLNTFNKPEYNDIVDNAMLLGLDR